jgi:steroid Delta-isomerase
MNDLTATPARFVTYWESLTLEAVQDLPAYYTADAYFRDPFNEVHGQVAISRIFSEMFTRLIEPRFHIIETVSQPGSAFLIWDFMFRFKSFKPEIARTIHGTTHVRFAPDGRVSYHRDYWDAAAELYEHLPVIGGVLRHLRRRFA